MAPAISVKRGPGRLGSQSITTICAMLLTCHVFFLFLRWLWKVDQATQFIFPLGGWYPPIVRVDRIQACPNKTLSRRCRTLLRPLLVVIDSFRVSHRKSNVGAGLDTAKGRHRTLASVVGIAEKEMRCLNSIHVVFVFP